MTDTVTISHSIFIGQKKLSKMPACYLLFAHYEKYAKGKYMCKFLNWCVEGEGSLLSSFIKVCYETFPI